MSLSDLAMEMQPDATEQETRLPLIVFTSSEGEEPEEDIRDVSPQLQHESEPLLSPELAVLSKGAEGEDNESSCPTTYSEGRTRSRKRHSRKTRNVLRQTLSLQDSTDEEDEGELGQQTSPEGEWESYDSSDESNDHPQTEFVGEATPLEANETNSRPPQARAESPSGEAREIEDMEPPASPSGESPQTKTGISEQETMLRATAAGVEDETSLRKPEVLHGAEARSDAIPQPKPQPEIAEANATPVPIAPQQKLDTVKLEFLPSNPARQVPSRAPRVPARATSRRDCGPWPELAAIDTPEGTNG